MNKPSIQQWERFKLWLDNDCDSRKAKLLPTDTRETIKQAIAAVFRRMHKR